MIISDVALEKRQFGSVEAIYLAAFLGMGHSYSQALHAQIDGERCEEFLYRLVAACQ